MENKFQRGTGTRGYDKPANFPRNSRTKGGQTKEQKEEQSVWIPHAKGQDGPREACKDPRPGSEKKEERGKGDGCQIEVEAGPVS